MASIRTNSKKQEYGHALRSQRIRCRKMSDEEVKERYEELDDLPSMDDPFPYRDAYLQGIREEYEKRFGTV